MRDTQLHMRPCFRMVYAYSPSHPPTCACYVTPMAQRDILHGEYRVTNILHPKHIILRASGRLAGQVATSMFIWGK
jgi:hypothetical protein